MTTETTASPAPPRLSQTELEAFTSTIQTQLDAFVKASNDAVAQMTAASAAAAKSMQQAAATTPPTPAQGAPPTMPPVSAPLPPTQPLPASPPNFTPTADGINLLAILQANPVLAYLVLALVNAYRQTQAMPARP